MPTTYHIPCTLPHYRFEWHPESEKLFVVREHRKPVVGDPIAESVTTEGQAIMYVLLWMRGFRECDAASVDSEKELTPVGITVTHEAPQFGWKVGK